MNRIWKRLHYTIFSIKLKEDTGFQQPPHHKLPSCPEMRAVLKFYSCFLFCRWLTWLTETCNVTSIPFLTKVHTFSCSDGVTQIWFPNSYRMNISTRVTTRWPVIGSPFVWPTGKRISSSPYHVKSNPHSVHNLGRLWGDHEGFMLCVISFWYSLVNKGFQFNGLCNENRDGYDWRVQRWGIVLLIGTNGVGFTWRWGDNPVCETLSFEKYTGRSFYIKSGQWIM